MRDAILPPVSTQFYNFGNNETQIPSMDLPIAMDNNVNLQESSVYWEPNFSFDRNQQRSVSSANPYQPIVNFQPSSMNLRGYQSTSSDMKSISCQSMLSKKIPVPDVQMDLGTINLRKRVYEVGSLMSQTGISDVVEPKKARFSREWMEKKSTKAKFTAEKLHNLITQSNNIQDNDKDVKLQVPVRRSQKLSDKITSLQKLVSPYGKTDTASVLQEASLYIKLLHEQIQNLFDMMSTSYLTGIDVEFQDLKKRGFCLVPTSLAPSLTKEDRLHPQEYSK